MRYAISRIFTAIFTLLTVAAAGAARADHHAAPAPDPADVASIDAIIGAVYDVISGPAGEARDWDRFKSLFAPGARLMPLSAQNGVIVWSPQDYVDGPGTRLEERGFFEIESHRTTEEYGGIAHAFSTYESRNNADDPEPFSRGINSFQLARHDGRWWIVSIFWQSENEDRPIPERYLP